jgi:23S rRNA (pseudouridine1915-N3)-methyltransferase
MRIVIAAVGRLKQGPERDLAERYRKRAAECGRSVGSLPIDIIEIRESRADSAERRMLEESIAIANVIPERAVTAILDERGQEPHQRDLRRPLQAWRARDSAGCVFIIGGADGLAPTLQENKSLTLALGQPPGRTSWCGSCSSSKFTEPLPYCGTSLSPRLAFTVRERRYAP